MLAAVLLVALAAILSRLAQTHRETLMAARTWLQQAPPITFGLKVAGWLGAIALIALTGVAGEE